MENIYKEQLKKLSILYVEDEESAREGLKFILQNRVRAIFLGENGKVGLEKYIKYKPDIVITDIKMPYMDGTEMVKAIKKINPYSKIIYISAHTEIDILLKVIDAGVDQFVPKPISKNSLFFALSKATKMIIQERELVKKNLLIQLILDSQENMVVLTTGKKTLSCNRSTLEFFGTKSFDELKDKFDCISEAFIKEEPYLYVRDDGKNWAEEALDISHQYEVLLFDEMRGENREFIVKSAPFIIEDENMKYVVTFTDITDLNFENNRNKDALTQVYNRRYIKKLLDDFIEYYKNSQKHFTSIMFSIDNLDEINKDFGEDYSDDLIVEASSNIQSMLNKHFFIGRYNGAKFIILAPLVDKERAKNIAKNINETLKTVNNIKYSISICEYQNEEDSATYMQKCIQTLDKSKENHKIEII